MLKSYKLRAPYEGTLVGGSVNTGLGEALDIKEALESGGGEIVTDDVVLQSVLDNYYGDQGLVFKSTNASKDSAVTVEPSGTFDPANPASSPESSPPVQTPPAEHGDQSQYATFSVEELRSTAQERGLRIPPKTTQNQLVELLENDDNERAQAQQEGAGNGS